MMDLRKVCVIGVGMTKFYKPGEKDFPELSKDAGEQALKDAGVAYEQIEQAFVGYVYGESTCGQRAIYQLGLTGVPVYNVNNNCSTGSTALYMGYQAVGSGLNECVIALGFEKMERGSLGAKYSDRTHPMDRHIQVMIDKQGYEDAPAAAQMFGGAGREHMERYGTTKEQLAKVAVKNRRHAVKNERSQFRVASSLEEVLAAPTVFEPLTKFQCCPTSDGSAAAVLCSEEFAKKLGITNPVTIEGMAMTTDFPTTFDPPSLIKMVGQDLTKAGAKQVYEKAGLGPEDNRNGHRAHGHNGGAPGISSSLSFYPELGYTVAVMSNYDAGAMRVARFVEKMIGEIPPTDTRQLNDPEGDPINQRPPYRMGAGLELDNGEVLISFVQRDSPAARAGLVADDVMLAVNGQAVDGNAIELLNKVLRTPDAFSIEVRRGDETLTLSLTPEKIAD